MSASILTAWPKLAASPAAFAHCKLLRQLSELDVVQSQPSNAQSQCWLDYSDSTLAIHALATNLPPLTSLDLINIWQHRLKSYRGNQEPLLKAIGKRARQGRVIDLTAGLGRDSMVMAKAGAQVTLLEQHPLIVCLLIDAIEKAERITALKPISARLQVCWQDAFFWLEHESNQTTVSFDAWYCDPMFEHATNKTARNKRPMQILQACNANVSQQPLAGFALAHLSGNTKLVVKRSRSSVASTEGLNHQIDGKNWRLDIYLNSGPKSSASP